MVMWVLSEDDLGNPGFPVPPGQIRGCRARHAPAPVHHRGCSGKLENHFSGKTMDETPGKLKHLHKERKQIEKWVEEAFEQIDPELWR